MPVTEKTRQCLEEHVCSCHVVENEPVEVELAFEKTRQSLDQRIWPCDDVEKV